MNLNLEYLIMELAAALSEELPDPSMVASHLNIILSALISRSDIAEVSDPCGIVDGLTNRLILDNPRCRDGLKRLRVSAPLLADVVSGMGHCLHDTDSAPEIAKMFGCTPEQLLASVEAYTRNEAG